MKLDTVKPVTMVYGAQCTKGGDMGANNTVTIRPFLHSSLPVNAYRCSRSSNRSSWSLMSYKESVSTINKMAPYS